MTESVTPPSERLVDPETGETPPLSPPRARPALSSEPLVFVVDPALRRAYIEGTWDDVTEPDDAA